MSSENKPAAGSMGFEIRTPTATFSGERAGVKFHEGRGKTSNPTAANECAALGYQVTDLATGEITNHQFAD